MLLGVPKESYAGEHRAPLVPAGVKKIKALGLDVQVEAGLGVDAGYSDAQYQEAGAAVIADRDALFANADILLRIRKPEAADVTRIKAGAVHVSFLDPFNEEALVKQMAASNVTAISMEMIPRSTYAQKMDALSSQANLAGYVAVMLSAHHLPKILPMMMTPAGTISPAKVFIIGAGVAGLQAIATAKRLGARVEAFDTRPVVAEQVQSLGAKFVQIDIGETGQTAQGYARELTPEQIKMQQVGMKKVIADADVVITTAQVFGRPAPRIVTRDMVEGMRPGSVVLDMAVETGGNVEGSVLGQVTDINGVNVIGFGNLPAYVARNASEMYSANVANLIEEMWNKADKTLKLDFANDVLKGCVITHGGAVVHETFKARYS